MRRLLVGLVVVAVASTMAAPALADPLPPLTDSIVGLTKVIPLPTLPFGPTDIDPSSLVVTDDELASAGQLLPSLSETAPDPTSPQVALTWPELVGRATVASVAAMINP